MADLIDQTEFNRVHALMKFERDDLVQWLGKFFGMEGQHGTYVYDLTRTKEAFGVGTMTFDDFVEFSDERVEELADFLIEKLKET